ncbi:hypothetical protein [Amycolatopsis sp. DG1A-15b]|uniref:hypothetical protein n=1 Tax=Amycolatopsis sp. DG1A-15b TaxID=3052846 RepID=UPI00255C1BB3|nr:hypothetical protein [Amycolatopsis sp. DG1A-15b]WIX87767.1 hypothetical protein QRY02_42630 [Amycolatopsis sp. DG1A-15b]
MVGFIAALIYLIAATVVAKWYFARRHGVAPSKGDTGTVTAGLVGLAWPLSVWLPQVRRPEPCGHHGHVLGRQQVRQEMQAVEELKRGRER